MLFRLLFKQKIFVIFDPTTKLYITSKIRYMSPQKKEEYYKKVQDNFVIISLFAIYAI